MMFFNITTKPLMEEIGRTVAVVCMRGFLLVSCNPDLEGFSFAQFTKMADQTTLT